MGVPGMLRLASLATETSEVVEAERDNGGELGGVRNDCRAVGGNTNGPAVAVGLGANGSASRSPDGGETRPSEPDRTLSSFVVNGKAGGSTSILVTPPPYVCDRLRPIKDMRFSRGG